VFFDGEYVDQSLSNCLILFISAARKLINHLNCRKERALRRRLRTGGRCPSGSSARACARAMLSACPALLSVLHARLGVVGRLEVGVPAGVPADRRRQEDRTCRGTRAARAHVRVSCACHGPRAARPRSVAGPRAPFKLPFRQARSVAGPHARLLFMLHPPRASSPGSPLPAPPLAPLPHPRAATHVPPRAGAPARRMAAVRTRPSRTPSPS
jgi:hypothetical protein